MIAAIRIVAAVTLLTVLPPGFAQVPSADEENVRRSPDAQPVPPMKGGSIAPGETAGIPNSAPNLPPERDEGRCKELDGKLREACLRDLDAAAGGATRPPRPLPDEPARR